MTARTTFRGAQPQREGWLFTGRRAVLQRIVTWMGDNTPGALVVTGPAGCGKSAVLEHITALSDPSSREELLAHGPAGPDPGVGAVDASVDLRGMDEQDLAVTLAEQLGLRTPQAGWQLIADLTRMASPPILVLDGLDDAIPEHLDKIATELLVALGTVARVLLTTQHQEFLWSGPPSEGARYVDLQEMFGRDVPVIDLDVDADTPDDIAQYVARRLRAAGRGDLVDQVAPALASRAGEFGGFLYARIMTTQILRCVIDVSAQGWHHQLATTVGGALDRDLSTGVTRVGIPSAARDLLSALAWSLGRGMPRVAWQAAATALSPDGVRYRATDLDWVLEHYGCYVVEDEQHGEAIYRLCHQELTEHLLGSELPVPGSPAAEALAEALVALPESKPPAGGEPDRRSPYLRRHLTRHASVAGTFGVDALYRLVKDTPEVYLPELAVSVHQLATKLVALGEHETALAPVQRAISIYRVLTEANPTTYLPFLAMVLNDHAVYLSATGQREPALAPAAEAVDTFRVLTETDPAAYLTHLVTALNNLTGHLAGLDRISAGVDVYTTCVDAFVKAPEVRDALIIERAGFHVRHGDPPTGFRELAGLLGPSEGPDQTDTPDALLLAARNALRGHRSRNPLDCDHAWWTVNQTSPPDWLSLTPEQLNVVTGWIASPTWRQSKSYFTAHEEELSDDSAFVVLEELLLLIAPLADRHLELLDEIMAAGVDAAYQPLLLEDLVTAWISVANWQESRSFAERHATELITREAETALIRLGHATATVVHLALLGLARQDGLEAAYDCVTDRRLAADRMRRALGEAESNTIIALAMLEGRVFGESFAAAAHLAVAGVLAGAPMSDTTRLEELAAQADAAERQRVTTEIAELIVRVPEHAGRLGSLPKILLPEVPRQPDTQAHSAG
ncbi:MAG: hypothetical protein ACRDSR_09995 [Pseudonocardiaceae bacterium]